MSVSTKAILEPQTTYEEASAIIAEAFEEFCMVNRVDLGSVDMEHLEVMQCVFEQGFRRGLSLGLDAALSFIRDTGREREQGK